MKALTLLHSIPALCLAATAEPMVRVRLIDEVNLNIEIRKLFPYRGGEDCWKPVSVPPGCGAR